MKTTLEKILTAVLTPASWMYGAGMWVRNKMFDSGILREVEYGVPIIGVGNLTIGGTGKTPHVEYIIQNLCNDYKVAVLSRGYKRKTRGFILANSHSTPESIGDEPWQIFNKFGSKIKVAVCERRRKGIEELLRLYPDLDMILLDDSYQHRWVKPAASICLMEYGRPIYNDKLLPLGRLRESSFEINRADMVIVTKCPDNATQLELRIIANELNLMKFQKLYFSRYSYGELKPIFPDENPYNGSLIGLGSNDSVLLLTGIAHPRYFVRHFREYPFAKRVMHYSDHHNFSRRDIADIEERFRRMKGERKLIVTTEKDAVRLAHNPYFPNELKPFIFYQPISVTMIEGLFDHDNDLIPDIREVIRNHDKSSLS
ncbi:MAG: tetraacyldisaccharide 4'-kinase [Muribaculaceae bacterium]|nr:tetraacyldisaccharide 4'-kinase [Muribaculaceae bacterium]